MSAEGKTVNLQTANDLDVLFGEVSDTPLMTLETLLAGVYQPLIEGMKKESWGVCDEEQQIEFKQGVEKFTKDLSEAKSSLTGGIEL